MLRDQIGWITGGKWCNGRCWSMMMADSCHPAGDSISILARVQPPSMSISTRLYTEHTAASVKEVIFERPENARYLCSFSFVTIRLAKPETRKRGSCIDTISNFSFFNLAKGQNQLVLQSQTTRYLHGRLVFHLCIPPAARFREICLAHLNRVPPSA